jgi:hypothetical protein
MASGYEPSWDKPHTPGTEENWQESDWLSFYDPRAEVGGIYRIGQRPGQDTGQPGLFVFALDGDRFFADDNGGRLDVPITAEDRWVDGYRSGNLTVHHPDDGRIRFAFHYPEARGELEFYERHYEPRSWSLGPDVHELYSQGHLECGGKVRGTLTIGARTYQVDCFAHRDRSWGVRRGYVERVRQILTGWGSAGPGFSYAVMKFVPVTGEASVQGFLMRDHVADEIVDFRQLTVLDDDYVSGLGGTLILTLASGEKVTVKCTLAQCHADRAPGSAFSGVGTFRSGQHEGFCTYSGLANPSRGTYKATQDEVKLAVVDKGLSRSVRHPDIQI